MKNTPLCFHPNFAQKENAVIDANQCKANIRINYG